MMEPDFRVAARYLRQRAPTQTHENRRNFQAAAEFLEAANFGDVTQAELPKVLAYSIPVRVSTELARNKLLGNAQLFITLHKAEEISVISEFKRWWVADE
jgi:hypothetical protein